MPDVSNIANNHLNSNHSKRGGIVWLLLIPFIATLFPFFFNYREPTIIGVPFFYWYQLVWIPITVFLTWLVYRVEE